MRQDGNNGVPILLAVVIVLHVILAVAWIRTDRTPPYWDEAWYLWQGATQLEHLREGDLRGWFAAWSSLDRTRPSLVPALTVPFFAAFGVSAASGLLVNVAALVALLLAVYALGSAVHSPRAGLVAAMVVGGFPALIGLVHILLVEMVMLTFVAATLLALWRSEGLEHRGWALAAGLLTGLGFLSKVFYGVFVAGPWLVTLWRAWRNRPSGVPLIRLRSLHNLAASALLAVAAASTWYGQNLSSVLRRSSDAAVGAEAAAYGPAHPLYWRNLAAYLNSVIGRVVSPAGLLLLLLALAGLWIAHRRSRRAAPAEPRARRAPFVFLASSVVLAYLVFTSIRNQDAKHITGMLPGLAVLIGWGVTELLGRRGAVGAAAIGLVMMGQAVLGTWPGPLQDRRLEVNVLGQPLLLFYPAQSWGADTRYAAPDPRPWPLLSVLHYAHAVGQLMPDAASPVRVGTIPDAPGVEEHALRFEAQRQGVALDVHLARAENLSTMDVLIHKTGDWGFWPRHAEIAEILEALEGDGSAFQRLPRAFALPDGSEVVLYARVPAVLEAGEPAHRASVEFQGAGRFLGYDCSVSGDAVDVRFYWESHAPTEGDYTVFVHLIDPHTGAIVAQDDHLLLDRIYPTSTWQPGRRVAETRRIPVPGAYGGESLIMRLGLYQGAARLPVVSSEAPAGPDYADVGEIGLGS